MVCKKACCVCKVYLTLPTTCTLLGMFPPRYCIMLQESFQFLNVPFFQHQSLKLKTFENIRKYLLYCQISRNRKKQLNLGVNELQLLQNFTGKYSKLSFIVIVGCYYAKSSLNHIWKTKTKDFMTKDNSIFLTQYSLTKFFFGPPFKVVTSKCLWQLPVILPNSLLKSLSVFSRNLLFCVFIYVKVNAYLMR